MQVLSLWSWIYIIYLSIYMIDRYLCAYIYTLHWWLLHLIHREYLSNICLIKIYQFRILLNSVKLVHNWYLKTKCIALEFMLGRHSWTYLKSNTWPRERFLCSDYIKAMALSLHWLGNSLVDIPYISNTWELCNNFSKLYTTGFLIFHVRVPVKGVSWYRVTVISKKKKTLEKFCLLTACAPCTCQAWTSKVTMQRVPCRCLDSRERLV